MIRERMPPGRQPDRTIRVPRAQRAAMVLE